MKTKDKLRKLAKIVNEDISTVKQSIRMASTISGVTFTVALDSMLEANDKPVPLSLDSIQINK